MEHDPGRLPAIDANALKMSVKQVKKFSPDTLSIMEFKNQRDIDITDLIYDGNSLLGMPKGDWKSIEWGNELHMTKYSSLLLDKDIGNNNISLFMKVKAFICLIVYTHKSILDFL